MQTHLFPSVVLVTQQRQTPNPDQLYDLAMAQYSVGRISDAEASLLNAQNAGATFKRADEAKQFLELISLSATLAKAAEGEATAKQILQTKHSSIRTLFSYAFRLREIQLN